jgi:hypothetical protein
MKRCDIHVFGFEESLSVCLYICICFIHSFFFLHSRGALQVSEMVNHNFSRSSYFSGREAKPLKRIFMHICFLVKGLISRKPREGKIVILDANCREEETNSYKLFALQCFEVNVTVYGATGFMADEFMEKC